jgi:hypothetical protein
MTRRRAWDCAAFSVHRLLLSIALAPGVTVVGAAWVWTRASGVWTQQGPKLVPPERQGDSSVDNLGIEIKTSDLHTYVLAAR